MKSITLLTTTTAPTSPPPSFPSKSSSKPPVTIDLRPSQSPGTREPRRRRSPRFSEKHLHPLHPKNPHIIHRDLRRLARLGRLPDALTVLDYLDHRGIPISISAFSSLLSAASFSRHLPAVRHLHAHLRINGLHANPFLLSKLAHAYAACGAAADARAALSTALDTPSPVPWNAFLRGLIDSGRRWSPEPAAVFSEMRELGFEPNEYTYSCLIKSFAGSPAPAPAAAAHALLVKNGYFSSSLLLQTGFVDVYFKSGKVGLALKMFDEIPDRDVVLWGAVIAGLAHNGLLVRAVEHLRQMVDEGIMPNTVILATILPVLGDLAERKLGREVHGYALKRFRDYNKFSFVLSGLIDMYCKCGDMVSGRHVFYGVKQRNVVMWTAMTSGYASMDRFEQALRCLVWMQQEGVKPDIVAVATALPVCSRLRALKLGKEIHAYALKRRFLPNTSLSTSLMTLYAECGSIAYSEKVFDVMEKKNLIAWTALINSNLKNSRPNDALAVFRTKRIVNCRPDAVAIARILNAVTLLRLMKLGKEIHGQVLKLKLEVCPLVAAGVVSMYGKCGDVEKARMVFDGVQSVGSLTATAIIEAYGVNDQCKEALYFFDGILSNGFVPSNYTFDVVLRLCRREGLHDKALQLFDAMVGKYKLKASEENYDCIIDLLSDVGCFDEAQRFIQLKSALFEA